MQYLVSKDNFTKITEPKGTLQNISRTLTIEVSNTQTENSGVLLPPMCKIQFDGNSVYVRCVDGAGAEARVIPFEVVVKGGDGGGTDFSLDQAGTTIVEDFKFSALEYPNATNPNLDGKTVLVMAVKDANATTQLVKYVFVDLAKLVGTSTLYKPSDNAIGISGASIGLNLSASAGNILSVADDGLFGWLGVAGGVSGNFAVIGESGAIVDGGFSFADFVTPDFTGATSGISGLSGLVPAPQAGDEFKFLRGDGTWSGEIILPTASNTTKGGVKIGSGLSMDGDTLSVTIQSGSAGGTVLDTVPSTVDGGLWYEVTDDVPALWFHKGNYDYRYTHDKMRFVGTANDALVAYLPFTSTLDDVCDNIWTASGSPTIADGACSFNGSSYLVLNEAISLGGRNFTADAWFKSTANQNWRTALYIGNLSATNSYNLLCLTQAGNTLYFSTAYGQNFALINDFQNNVRRHIAFVYSHAEEAVKVFLDGELKQTVSMAISRTAVQLVLGSGFLATDVAHFTGALDHVRIFDGVTLWTSNFTPPTAGDYV